MPTSLLQLLMITESKQLVHQLFYKHAVFSPLFLAVSFYADSFVMGCVHGSMEKAQNVDRF